MKAAQLSETSGRCERRDRVERAREDVLTNAGLAVNEDRRLARVELREEAVDGTKAAVEDHGRHERAGSLTRALLDERVDAPRVGARRCRLHVGLERVLLAEPLQDPGAGREPLGIDVRHEQHEPASSWALITPFAPRCASTCWSPAGGAASVVVVRIVAASQRISIAARRAWRARDAVKSAEAFLSKAGFSKHHWSVGVDCVSSKTRTAPPIRPTDVARIAIETFAGAGLPSTLLPLRLPRSNSIVPPRAHDRMPPRHATFNEHHVAIGIAPEHDLTAFAEDVLAHTGLPVNEDLVRRRLHEPRLTDASSARCVVDGPPFLVRHPLRQRDELRAVTHPDLAKEHCMYVFTVASDSLSRAPISRFFKPRLASWTSWIDRAESPNCSTRLFDSEIRGPSSSSVTSTWRGVPARRVVRKLTA